MSRNENYKPTQTRSSFSTNFITKKFISKAQPLPRSQAIKTHSSYNPNFASRIVIQNKALTQFAKNLKQTFFTLSLWGIVSRIEEKNELNPFWNKAVT